MTMDNAAIHDLLVTMQNNCAEKRGQDILGVARMQFEDMLAKDAPPMLNTEIALPNKNLRISAYRTRTQVSATVAHAVINVNWRNVQRSHSAN